MDWKYFLRGWIFCTAIQQLAMLIQTAWNSESLQKSLIREGSPLSRPYVSLFCLLCAYNVLLKACLLCSFESRTLHMFHAVSNALYVVYSVVEIVHYEFFTLSIASCVQILSAGLSTLFTVVSWSQLRSEEDAQDKSRPRRLIAKHYMENQISNFAKIK
ncbi:hypothetical protein AAVH_01288 [Aphelenchoides avenae]|nr:hypothetical protein AAVH_01288 [Aphelenchus avenae]